MMRKSVYNSVEALVRIAEYALQASRRVQETEHDKQLSDFFMDLAEKAINEANVLLERQAAA